jgi:hypothetical protein
MEAVGGYQVSDAGSATFIGIDEQRERLKTLSPGGTGMAPNLSLEWVIRRIANRVAPSPN